MAVMIKTVNLTKRYGTLVALSNLNLEINEGDCFGFIGPNGAGKSTTIKILATLLQPTWGEARICDFVVGYTALTKTADYRGAAVDASFYALNYARDMDRNLADRFVGMYVNDWTLDYGPRGRAAVARLLDEAHRAGIIPEPVKVEFVE